MFLITPENMILLIAAYLIGSIPTALWVGKAFYNVDLREKGSRNAGATNTIRILGVKTGVPVLVFDIFKGFIATKLTAFLDPNLGNLVITQVKLLLGLIAVMGHLFPIFAQFQGGKGIATLLGIFFGIHPLSALVSLGIFAVGFTATRIVSVSSLLAVTAYPIITWFIFNEKNTTFTAFILLFVAVVWYTHRHNLRRILKGKEKRISLR